MIHVSQQANGWQGVATRTTFVIFDITPPSDMRYAEIGAKRAQWLNWPYARVSVDWFVNTSATSDAGDSAGVYSQLRMQYSGSSDIWLRQIRGTRMSVAAGSDRVSSVFCSRTGVHVGLHGQGEVGHSRWTTADDWCSATAGPECRAVRRHGTAAAKLYTV